MSFATLYENENTEYYQAYLHNNYQILKEQINMTTAYIVSRNMLCSIKRHLTLENTDVQRHRVLDQDCMEEEGVSERKCVYP